MWVSSKYLYRIICLLAIFSLSACGSGTSGDPAVAGVAPTIDSQPGTLTVTQGTEYVYDIKATDADGDTLSFEILESPEGLTLDTTSGQVSWTPTTDQIGSHDVKIQITDNSSETLSIEMSFTIVVEAIVVENNKPEIVSDATLTATEGVEYRYNVEVTDSKDDVLSFELLVLPSGMLIDAENGEITWTPTAEHIGTRAVLVRVSDNGDPKLSKEQSFSIMVKAASVEIENTAPQITSTAKTVANEGISYSYSVVATDVDDDDLSYELSNSPTGMSIDAVSGVISWMPMSEHVGTSIVVVRVSDDGTPGLSAEQAFNLVVTAAIVVDNNTRPIIKSTPTTIAFEGVLYEYDVQASDADEDALTYRLDDVPNGLIIDGSGRIRWTPQQSYVGQSVPVIVTVTDNGEIPLSVTQEFNVVVREVNVAPVISSTAITTAMDGVAYEYTVQATDSNAADSIAYVLSIAPDGMTLNPTTGEISWLPISAQIGSHNVEVIATDNGLSALSSEPQVFSVSVVTSNIAPEITSTFSGNAYPGLEYTYQVIATDSNADSVLTFALSSEIPAGMNINAENGLIRWLPDATHTGIQTAEVVVTDNGTPELSFSQQITILVADINIQPTITTEAIIVGYEGVEYVYDVNADDDNRLDTQVYGVVDSPLGLVIDSETGVITWTPTAAQVGSNNIKVTVIDNGLPQLIAEQVFSIEVAEKNIAPTFMSTPVEIANEDVEYTYPVLATDQNSSDSLTFELSVKPASMQINPTSGLITWTPGVGDAAIVHDVTVRVRDNGLLNLYSIEDHIFQITVAPANVQPQIDITALNIQAYPRVEYLYDTNATDGNENDDITYSLELLPAGMVIDAITGVVTWTPTIDQTGVHNIIVRATDNGVPVLFDEVSFDITVAENNLVPTITSIPGTTAEANVEYVYALTFEDLNTADTHTVAVTGPEGLNFDPLTNMITWTPTSDQLATGQHMVTITVTDNGLPAGVSDPQEFSIGVQDLLAPSIPDQVNARSVNATQININWNPSIDNGGGAIGGYNIWRGDILIGTVGPDLDVGLAVFTYRDKGRKANRSYTYQIEAFDMAKNPNPAYDPTDITSSEFLPANISEKSLPFTVVVGGLPFSERFDSSSEGWVIVDDGPGSVVINKNTSSEKTLADSDWRITNGEFVQSFERGMLNNSANRRAALENQNTYHIGTYAYYPGLQWLSDYSLSLDITPIEEPGYDLLDDGHDIGVMFRYEDSDNYYRISLNSEYGFARLERKLDGVFSTLAVDAKGYKREGTVISIQIELVGNLMQVYIDGEPRFAAMDGSFSKGGLALYTQDGAKFDNVVITTNDTAPSIVIDQPEAHTAQAGSSIKVSAVALNATGDTVQFTINGDACIDASEISTGYFTSTCLANTTGEHTIKATLVLAGASDTNVMVGSSGDVRIVIGDSLSNGVYDTVSSDNRSNDGKVIGEQGPVAVQQNLIGDLVNKPQIIFNEAVPGDTSTDLASDRMPSIMERHPDATIAHVLIGTNDASNSRDEPASKVESNIKEIIKTLEKAGIIPIVALIPPSFQGDPLTSSRNARVISYNDRIRGLPRATGPDLFAYFLGAGENRVSLFSNDEHFNGLGYAILGSLWASAIATGDSSLPLRSDLPLILEQICVQLDSPTCQDRLLYKQDLMQEGNPLYVDSSDSVISIPTVLDGGVWLRTMDVDKGNSRDEYLSFNVDRDVTVYVAYDDSDAIPSWLSSGFMPTSDIVEVSSGVDLRVYEMSVTIAVDASINTIRLGGNNAAGGNATVNYMVIVK